MITRNILRLLGEAEIRDREFVCLSCEGYVLSFLPSSTWQSMSKNGGGSNWIDSSGEGCRAGGMERQGAQDVELTHKYGSSSTIT